jgi:Fe2+ transport system protein FeoA
LVLVREGEKVKVSKVLGGPGLVRRIMDMGLRPGTEIEIVAASKAGPFVLRVEGLRLGLGFGIARKIFVELAR